MAGQISDFLVLVLFVLFSYEYVVGKALVGEAKETFAKKFLSRYGYYHGFNINAPLQSETVRRFQAFAGIPVTGEVDETTTEKMNQPRCSQGDPVDKFVKKYGNEFGLKISTSNNLSRKKRFILQGTNWEKTFARKKKDLLRWVLRNSGRSLSFDIVEKTMEKAFGMWQAVTNVDFERVPRDQFGTPGNEEKDIEILVSFETYVHNDGNPFDGRGGVLAHAFYPGSNLGFSGDVHFDDDEQYTYQSPQGTDIMWVAVHEIGHSLGLEHTHIQGAIMYPFYGGYNANIQLHDDDRIGIQNLYGSRRKLETTTTKMTTTTAAATKTTTIAATRKTKTMATTTTTTTQQPYTKPDKDFCLLGYNKITALFYSYAYRQVMAITKTKRMLFLKNKIGKSLTNKLPANIDAAFELRSLGKRKKLTVFFSGERYYIYNKFKKLSGPHSIHNGRYPLFLKLPRWVKKIDAALKWMGNDRVYFFIGRLYYRYNLNTRRLDRFYPKVIQYGWRGLPERVDAAFSSPFDERQTLLILGDTYYSYDTRNIRLRSKGKVESLLRCTART